MGVGVYHFVMDTNIVNLTVFQLLTRWMKKSPFPSKGWNGVEGGGGGGAFYGRFGPP